MTHEDRDQNAQMTIQLTAPSRAWAGSVISIISTLKVGDSFIANVEVPLADIADETREKLNKLIVKLDNKLRTSIQRARVVLGTGAEFKTERSVHFTNTGRCFVMLIITRMQDL